MTAQLLTVAIVALLLASIGITGLAAQTVNERTREIAIRKALGATTSQIVSKVMRRGLESTGLGLVVGLALALYSTSLLEGVLYGVEAIDTITFAAGAIVLFGVSTLANYFPTRRVASIDP